MCVVIFPTTIHDKYGNSPSNKSPHCILLANSNIRTRATPAPPTTYTTSVPYPPTTTSTTWRTGINSPRMSSPADGKSPSKNSTRSGKPLTHGPPMPTTSQNQHLPSLRSCTWLIQSCISTTWTGAPPRATSTGSRLLPMGPAVPPRLRQASPK